MSWYYQSNFFLKSGFQDLRTNNSFIIETVCFKYIFSVAVLSERLKTTLIMTTCHAKIMLFFLFCVLNMKQKKSEADIQNLCILHYHLVSPYNVVNTWTAKFSLYRKTEKMKCIPNNIMTGKHFYVSIFVWKRNTFVQDCV